MLRRFYSEFPIQGLGCEFELSDTEAHHLLHVLRAQVGERVCVFDGQGGEYESEIVGIGRRDVRLRAVNHDTDDRELEFPLELAVSMPRGDRQDWLVQKAVEVGVTRLIPCQTERSVARPNAKTMKRFRRTVVEASKQCRRNRLMEIAPTREFDEWVAEDWNAMGKGLRLLAHIDAAARPLTSFVNQPDTLAGVIGIRMVVGPEGGFSDREVALAADQGWHAIRLGLTTLRTETAAIVMSAHLAMVMAERNSA